MKKSIISFFCLFSTMISFAQHENHQAKVDTNKIVAKPKSPKMVVMEMIGDNHIHIEYSSPSVRGRSIWNGLVAYDQVWSTGAHKATWIDFSKDIMIEGVRITKGRYGFFTIPSKNKWTIILSKTWDMHLADDYQQANDIIRITIEPIQNKQITEALKYEILAHNKSKGTIKISWEYLSIAFDFENI